VEPRKRPAAVRRPPSVAGPVVSCAVVSGDALFSDLLAAMLQLRRGLRMVTQASSPQAALMASGGRAPDLVVVDVGSLTASAARDAEAMFVAVDGSRFLLIAPGADTFSPPPWVAKHRHAVVSKNGSFQDLLQHLETLFNDTLPPAATDAESFRHKPLTDREAEVVALMGEGLSTRQIAEVLGRSIFTIQTHRKRIAEKMGRLGCALSQRAVTHRNNHLKGGERDR